MIFPAEVLLEIVSFALYFVTILLICVVYNACKTSIDIPGPVRLPYIGNFLTILFHAKGDIKIWMEFLKRNYGSIVRVFYGNQMSIYLLSKDVVHEVLVQQKENFSARPHFINDCMAHMKDGLVCSNGEVFKRMRRLVNQYFHAFGLGQPHYEERVMDETEILCDILHGTDAKAIDAAPLINQAMRNIIHKMVFGHRLEYGEEITVNLERNVKALFCLSNALNPCNYFFFLKWSKLNPMNGMTESIKIVVEYVENEIKKHRATFDKNNIRDFIDLFLEAELEPEGNMLSTKNLVAAIQDILIAGSDSTAGTVLWLLLTMIKFPDVQEKCFNEILENVGIQRPVCLADKNKLKYTEAVMLETQRMCNIAIGSMPIIAQDDAYVSGYLVPKGSVLISFFEQVHYDESDWPSPYEFKPSRFLDVEGNIKIPSGFMPFSLGTRSCPGTALAKTNFFLMFTNILQKFRLENANSHTLTYRGVTNLTNPPKPFQLKFIPRD